MDANYPCAVEAGCEMAELIDQIGVSLSRRGMRLEWFRSSRSTNRWNVTVNAGIFPVDAAAASVRSTVCLEHLVHWEWTPRVGKTKRCAQYGSLLAAWQTSAYYERLPVEGDEPAPEPINPPELIARIQDAPNYEQEQAALAEAVGLIDIRSDGMPGDSGRLWALHASRMDETRSARLGQIARTHGLAWERGARRWYVTREQLTGVKRALESAGFVVALDLDAASTLSAQTA